MHRGETRVCPKCGVEKPHEDFYTTGVGPTGRVYRRTHCKRCDAAKALARYHRNPEPGRAQAKRFRQENPHKYPAYMRKWKYGMPYDGFEKLLAQQGGKCANRKCGRVLVTERGVRGSAKACLDHDHTTGKIRGILCHACNVSLGALREDRAVISGLLDYLATHNPLPIESDPAAQWTEVYRRIKGVSK